MVVVAGFEAVLLLRVMTVSVRKWGLLAAALVVAGCLCSPAVALAEGPANDNPSTPVALLPSWIGLDAAPSFRTVQGGIGNDDWPSASVNDADDPEPTCLGDRGFKSLWYVVDVPEPAVLKVTVTSGNVDRFQPVVSIYQPTTVSPTADDEVGCGLGGTNSRTDPSAVAAAYAYQGKHLIRVAQAVNTPPLAGQPAVTISVTARDVKPPKITIAAPGKIVAPGRAAKYTAKVDDLGAQVAWSTISWNFCDPECNQAGTRLSGDDETRSTEVRTYKWKKPGLHRVEFEIKDKAGNIASYSWAVYVRDLTRPEVSFSTAVPVPGTRYLRIAIEHNEYVKVRLLITQQRASGDPRELYRRIMTLYLDKDKPTAVRTSRRTVLLKPRVGNGSLVITGVARDRAGNASLLPTCVIDPVLGTGRCFKP
jgi:hypothetical protein